MRLKEVVVISYYRYMLHHVNSTVKEIIEHFILILRNLTTQSQSKVKQTFPYICYVHLKYTTLHPQVLSLIVRVDFSSGLRGREQTVID